MGRGRLYAINMPQRIEYKVFKALETWPTQMSKNPRSRDRIAFPQITDYNCKGYRRISHAHIGTGTTVLGNLSLFNEYSFGSPVQQIDVMLMH
jgi:hypothetical protein